MKILITGKNGFIAKNFILHLKNIFEYSILTVDRSTTQIDFEKNVLEADYIFHLAGVNRPKSEHEFIEGNVGLTEKIVDILIKNDKKSTIVFSSSTQADLDNFYGKSKKEAEYILQKYNDKGGNVIIYRLPNVFGKFGLPNYNSVVATFCYNLTRDIPIEIHDPDRILKLVHVDDLIADFLKVLKLGSDSIFREIKPVYEINLRDLSELLQSFVKIRKTNMIGNVGNGLGRLLYSTFISYYDIKNSSYSLEKKSDKRGDFVEVLKTSDSGQFSYFLAKPGVTRGEHFHHIKTEKFLVVKGRAKFQFQNMITGEITELIVEDKDPMIVDTIPGFAHNITNIGNTDLIVLLWANEIFNPELPDTIGNKIS